MKRRVLFLCTANSCRSQTADGIVNHLFGGKIAASACDERTGDGRSEISADILSKATIDEYITEKKGRLSIYA
ncbi:MAG: hypothetical protein K4571_04480 [Deltaproteobacteria bacterium]